MGQRIRADRRLRRLEGFALALPHDFPHHGTVYKYFQKWERGGIWQKIHDSLRHQLREKIGRKEKSTVAIADSQSVETTEKSGCDPQACFASKVLAAHSRSPPTCVQALCWRRLESLRLSRRTLARTVPSDVRRKGTRTKQGEVYGYDGGKKVKGRKRHLVVDSQGFIVGALVTEGNTPERLGAAMVILEHQEKLSDTEVIWADSGYSGQNLARVVRQICGANVEVIKRISKTFKILPKRWMVERTFGWLNRYRRLSKDYETHVENSEAMIYGSLIRLMIRRFAL